MDKIISAGDKYGSLENMLKMFSARTKKNLPRENTTKGDAVTARINLGRWIADCPDCKGAELVDAKDKRFFCFSCGNDANGGAYRAVKFPRSTASIEKELLNRKAQKIGDFQHPIFGELPREWEPGETVADLKKQRKGGE